MSEDALFLMHVTAVLSLNRYIYMYIYLYEDLDLL